MRDSRLAIRMCYSHPRQEQVELPPVHTRTKLITNNPIAAAQVFDRVMRAFFFQLSLEYHLNILQVRGRTLIAYYLLIRITTLGSLGS